MPETVLCSCGAAAAAALAPGAALPAAFPAPVPASLPASLPTSPAALRARRTRALQRAVELCGGQSALASAIGLSQSHVWNWLARERVPAEHCPAIERATLRKVRCEELRPDVDWACLREMARPWVHPTVRPSAEHGQCAGAGADDDAGADAP